MAEPVGHGARTSATGVTVLHKLTLPADLQPQLFVIVDTEEEFDWEAPFARANTAVTAMKHVHRVQAIFDRFRITPTYVIDYPVALRPTGICRCRRSPRMGGAVSAHTYIPGSIRRMTKNRLTRNSFTMNLPPSLQTCKAPRAARDDW